MIDKRLLNLCKESKKYIGLTVLMNWISVICNLMTIIVIGFSIQELFSLGNIENLKKKNINFSCSFRSKILCESIKWTLLI